MANYTARTAFFFPDDWAKTYVNSLQATPGTVICPYDSVIITLEHGISVSNFNFQLPPVLPQKLYFLAHFEYGAMLGVRRQQWNHTILPLP
jgi:hypothetical protein